MWFIRQLPEQVSSSLTNTEREKLSLELMRLIAGIVKRDTFDNIGGSIVNSVKDLVGIEEGAEESINIDVSSTLTSSY